MDIWDQINSSEFEELALYFLNENFPEAHWMPTPKTRDGNKDAKAEQIVSFGDVEFSNEYWAEAKFSSRKQSIQKAKLDSTLVSAFLSPNVRWVAFLTNRCFSISYQVRATRYLELDRKFISSPRFFNGDHLQRWLSQRKDLQNRYFPKSKNNFSKTPKEYLHIENAFILNVIDWKLGRYDPLKKIKKGESYILCINIESSKSGKADLFIQGDGIQLVESFERKEIVLNRGSNQINLKVIASSKKYSQKRITLNVKVDCKKIQDAERNIHLSVSISENIDWRIRHLTQIQNIQKVLQLIKCQSCFNFETITLIQGKGGSGKSYACHEIMNDIPDDRIISFYRFSEDQNYNSILLCQLILFSSTGCTHLEVANCDMITSSLKNSISDQILKLLISGSRGEDPENVVWKIYSSAKNTNLTTSSASGNRKCALVEDLHKLNLQNGLLFLKLIENISHLSLNIDLVASSRLNTYNYIDFLKKLSEFCTLNISMEDLKESDIITTLNEYFDVRLFRSIINHATSLIKTPLELESLLTYIQLEKDSGNKSLTMLSTKQALSMIVDKDFLHNLPNNGLEEVIVELVYRAGRPIPGEFIESRLDGNVIENLLSRRILKVTLSGDCVFYAPHHDLKQEMFINKKGLYPKRSLHDHLHQLIDDYPEFETELLGLMLLCEPKDRVQLMQKVISKAKIEFNKTKFGSAYPLIKYAQKAVLKNGRSTYGLKEKDRYLIWLLYADCLNHCVSTEFSLNELETISSELEALPASDWKTMIQARVDSEIINMKFWLWDLHDIQNLISKFSVFFEEQMSCHSNDEVSNCVISCYLTVRNRKMMILSLAGKLKQSHNSFKENIHFSREMSKINHEAFMLMDYAKGLYATDPALALELVQKAHKIFLSQENEFRRTLTASCEIVFLKNILNMSNISNLEEESRKLSANGFFQEFAKSRLKIIACLLSLGRFNEAVDEYQHILPLIPSAKGKWLHLRVHFDTIFNVIFKEKCFNEELYEYEPVSDFDKELYRHNKKLNSRSVIWSHQCHEPDSCDSLLIDARVW